MALNDKCPAFMAGFFLVLSVYTLFIYTEATQFNIQKIHTETQPRHIVLERQGCTLEAPFAPYNAHTLTPERPDWQSC